MNETIVVVITRDKKTKFEVGTDAGMVNGNQQVEMEDGSFITVYPGEYLVIKEWSQVNGVGSRLSILG